MSFSFSSSLAGKDKTKLTLQVSLLMFMVTLYANVVTMAVLARCHFNWLSSSKHPKTPSAAPFRLEIRRGSVGSLWNSHSFQTDCDLHVNASPMLAEVRSARSLAPPPSGGRGHSESYKPDATTNHFSSTYFFHLFLVLQWCGYAH